MIAWQITYTVPTERHTRTVIVPHELASKAVEWFEQECNPGAEIDRIVNLGTSFIPEVYRIGGSGFQTAEAAGAALAEALIDSEETDGPGTIDNYNAVGSSLYYNPLTDDGIILRGGRIIKHGSVMVFHVRQDNTKIDMQRIEVDTEAFRPNDAVVLCYAGPSDLDPGLMPRVPDVDYLAEYGAGIVFPVTDYPMPVTDSPQA